MQYYTLVRMGGGSKCTLPQGSIKSTYEILPSGTAYYPTYARILSDRFKLSSYYGLMQQLKTIAIIVVVGNLSVVSKKYFT
jgi:hypothetical protein